MTDIPGLVGARILATTSVGIAGIRGLEKMLGVSRVVLRPSASSAIDAVVGWGQKPNTAPARALAAARGVPYVRLEDGFVRSLDLGVRGGAPLSVVADDEGIYYDATGPSRLERILNGDDVSSVRLEEPGLQARARACMDRMLRSKLSKYNCAPVVTLPEATRPRVLVIDQTGGDLSRTLGYAPDRGADVLLAAALEEHPNAEILFKTHPDVMTGERAAHPADLASDPRVTPLTDAMNPVALLEQVDHVYVMTSLMGFEALMVGKPVTCFGAPFYAGWGLTDDRPTSPSCRAALERRTATPSVEEVFAAAYLIYARYLHPETGAAGSLEDVLSHLELQRQVHDTWRGPTVAVGFSAWKRGFLPSFLSSPGERLVFARDASRLKRLGMPEGARVVTWGAEVPTDLARLARDRGAPVWRMEDGFLRSVGLGSDLFAPASLVLDRRGIYYDPSVPSDLEVILAETQFTDDERERSEALRRRIVESRVSKYNVGQHKSVGPSDRRDRKVVLVVGQVEDDASIQLGCTGAVKTNEALLQAVRSQRPEAYVMYKPHPDVTSGNRRGEIPRDLVAALADEEVRGVTLATCLDVVDEVHTMTSFVGFEALLRGLPVTTYGQPFYAGWGLTEDREPHPRRTRRLSLQELIAGTLIRYPLYVSPTTGAFTTPERIVEHLEAARMRQPAPLQARIQTSWAGRQVRKGLNLGRYAAASTDAGRSLGRVAARAKRVLRSAVDQREEYALANLPELGVERALLLQGPAGPFFRRFAEELRQNGIGVTKVNFHAGDELFFPGPDAVPFRGPRSDFDDWVRRLLIQRGIDGIFLFGDCRSYHEAAIDIARELDIKVWVFEEGYLRPDWLTLEEHGVNGHSRMSKDPETYLSAYRQAGRPALEAPQPVGNTFRYAGWYHTLSAVAYTLANQGYPSYEHHQPLNCWMHMHWWLRGAARKKWFAHQEAHLLDEILGRWRGRYFFVPLQVHFDFQLRHAPYDDVVDFIHEVVESFAKNAPGGSALVFKHHPMDRPFREYGALFEALGALHGIEDRLYYVHDLNLPTLLKNAAGTVTMNSTVGLSSIHHGTPTKICGQAVYGIDGLVDRQALASFWHSPLAPDPELYEAFRYWLITNNQANGNIMRPLDELRTPTGVRWLL